MGRHKEPLDTGAPFRELAQQLRALRERAGLSYRDLAERIDDAGCSPSTLSRADRGDRLPRRSVVVAYGTACGASGPSMEALWTRTRDQARTPPRLRAHLRPRSTSARVLELICEPIQLLDAMLLLRRARGEPSLRELERRARIMDLPALPKSTLGDVLNGRRLPSEEQVLTYVLALGEPDSRLPRWRAAYRRTYPGRRPAPGVAAWLARAAPYLLLAGAVVTALLDP